jgi:rhamnogalacturonyl hydrolase YesR
MYRLLAPLVLVIYGCGSDGTAPASAPDVPPVTERIDEIFELAQDKYLAAATRLDTAAGLPRNAWDDGSWRQVGKRDWTTGFFPGILWQIYAHERDPAMLEQARKWTEVMRENQTFDRNHDIGFMMYSSFGNALEQTGDEDSYLGPLLTAAKTGAGRYSEKTGTIRSWDSKDENSHLTIIDNMMNLHLFTFAAERTGDSSYIDMVRSHADRTDQDHYRPDGSSFHVVDYNPEDGSIQRQYTHQGYADESAWARGQAWGIYGFLQMYEDLGEPRYLERARNAADYFISRLPEDRVPYWDFDAPDIPDEDRDASAAAIAASAFIRLTEATGDETYREVAIDMLDALSQPEYLADRDDPVGGLIKQQTGNKPAKLNRGVSDREAEISVNINYGDYYYLEALNLLDETS